MNVKLNDKDYDLFYSYLTEYDGEDKGIDENIKAWEENKSKWLGKLFNGDLIKSKEVSFSTPQIEKETAFRLLHTEFERMFELIDNYIDDSDYTLCYKSLNWNKPVGMSYETYWREMPNINYIFSIYAAADNATSDNYAICLKSDYIQRGSYSGYDTTKQIIPAGTKIIRVLNKFILPIIKEVASPEDYEWLTSEVEKYAIECSRLYQQTTTTGELCISIHPMDYVTMSDNSYNWSSCMSWANNGEYHCGTLEMLTSPYVVVAYLNGNKEYMDWNSKRWRELFIVDKDIILGIKGYPYHSDALEDIVIEWLRELAKENLGWTYYENINRTSHSVHFSVDHATKAVWNITFNKMYNDCYLAHPCIIGINNEEDIIDIDINASGPAIDIVDGTILDEELPENFVCHPTHLGMKQCVCCDYWVNLYDLHDNGYCDNCYEEEED